MTGALSLRGIARALGGEVCGQQVLAPGPSHTAKDKSLSIRLSSTNADGFIVTSFANDDWKVCRDYVKQRLRIVPDRLGLPRFSSRTLAPIAASETRADALAARREATNRKTAATIVSRLAPIIGNPGEEYLRDERGIDVDAIRDILERTDAIGWHPAVFFSERGHALHGQLLGCIIGIMTDPVTALPTGAISRTYVHEGHKVIPAKTLGSPAGIIRLSPDEEVLGGLHIAEGKETALAGMSIGLRPMWAVGSTSMTAKFPVVPGIEALTIVADNDANGAGQRACEACAARWHAAGREVFIIQPTIGKDLNDAIRLIWRAP